MFDFPFLIADPWFSEDVAILIGAYGGAGVGVFGGLIGTLCGLLVPRGKARGLVLGLLMFQGVLGALLLVTGLVALLMEQPYAIWYSMLLLGGLCAGLGFGLRPVMVKRYQQAENRRIEAEALRQG